MRRAKPIAPKRVHLQPGFAYDFVLVGAGHMMAGLCVFLKLRQPGARVLVVDRAVAPGGCWLEANSFAYWLSPVPIRLHASTVHTRSISYSQIMSQITRRHSEWLLPRR